MYVHFHEGLVIHHAGSQGVDLRTHTLSSPPYAHHHQRTTRTPCMYSSLNQQQNPQIPSGWRICAESDLNRPACRHGQSRTPSGGVLPVSTRTHFFVRLRSAAWPSSMFTFWCFGVWVSFNYLSIYLSILFCDRWLGTLVATDPQDVVCPYLFRVDIQRCLYHCPL